MNTNHNIEKTFSHDVEALIQALNNTSICLFMYFPKEKLIKLPKSTQERYNCREYYENMPEGFGEEVVNPDDYEVFNNMYYKINEGSIFENSIFHSKDNNYCWRVTLTTLIKDDDGEPEFTVGVIEDISEAFKKDLLVKEIQNRITEGVKLDDELNEVKDLIARSIGEQYYAIYHIWIKTRSFVCFQEKLKGILSIIGVKGNYDTAWDKYIENYIDDEYKLKVREFIDFDNLVKKLTKVNSIFLIYKRKNVGWTRGQFIVCKRDEDGSPLNVIYTVTDINEERKREIAQEKAEYEAEHDALTDVYNRNGFDKIINSSKVMGKKIGFAVVDIDNFKTLNDNNGHDIGDLVLKEVSNKLIKTLRNDDYVFRIGGDEFCIIFTNCTENDFNTICRRIKTIHHTINENLPKNIYVTLSAGICFSTNGYKEGMFLLADKALYETKRNGRAGCTLINKKGKIVKKWRDDDLDIHTQSSLNFNNTGLYRLEFPTEKGEKSRFYCNETTKAILGLSNDISPEDCYKIWASRINPQYIDAVKKTKDIMLSNKHAECTYLWNHPERGYIFLRSGGYGEVIKGFGILYGYIHSLSDTNIVEREDDNLALVNALSNVYSCSYYIDLINDTYSTFKIATGESKLKIRKLKASETIDTYLNVLVDPSYREIMKEFLDLKTLPKRMENKKYIDCEYLGVNDKNYCRARFLGVKYDKNGIVTHVLFVIISLDETKSKEIEDNIKNKKSIESLYNNVPGGIIMYEWNGQQLKTLHISEYYAKEYGYSLNSETGDNKGGPDFLRIHPDDVDNYRKAIYIGLTKTHYLNYVYRVWNKTQNRYVWVKVSAVAEPQDDGTSLVYALYTDVTEQKDIELELQKSKASLTEALASSNQLCYEYDPMLHVGECYLDENIFNLPKRIENYPDSLKDYDVICKEDVDLFIKTCHQMDSGKKSAHCDVRIKVNGTPTWYSCTFNKYFDAIKNRDVAILTVLDITLRVTAMDNYERRMQSLLGNDSSAICIGSCNLTNNNFDIVKVNDDIKEYISEGGSFNDLMNKLAKGIVNKDDKEKFKAIFTTEALIKDEVLGKMHVEFEYLLKLSNNHHSWVNMVVDLVKNPINEEIVGVWYINSIQIAKISKLLLNKTLAQDYPMSSIIFVDTDEYYLFNENTMDKEVCYKDYWKSVNKALFPLFKNKEDAKNITFTKELILKNLEKNNEYTYVFDSDLSVGSRLEIKFSYLDNEHNLILSSLRNITDNTLLDTLRYDNEHDKLTGLYNRSMTYKKIRMLLGEHPNDNFVILHFDIKHFHLYNTFFGEKAGDKLLYDVGDVFRIMDRDYDYWVYGRIESDVFCLFFPFDKEKYERHLSFALKILNEYRSDFLLEPSIGLYFIKDTTMPVEAMFSRATIAANASNSLTSNGVCLYNEEMEKRLVEEQEIVNEMHNAIIEEQFKVYLQPKYNLRTNKLAGAEALVRWISPTKGLISPGSFIPVFEKNGFIAELDRYMWEHVCMLLRKWMDEGKNFIPISVNVSRISIFSPSTVDYLKELVKKYNIDPRYLELELTETAYMDDPEEIKIHLGELQAAGFRILMDDFGSGYSSLNTLKDLPVDFLKLDMKFLLENEEATRGRLVLSSIIRMSKLLGLSVIAEGVEKESQADFLRSLGCEYVQGYLFGRPMVIEEFEKLLSVGKIELPEKSRSRFNQLLKIITENDSQNYIFGEYVPTPAGLLEYNDDSFAYVRVNKSFIKEFNLDEDLRAASLIFKESVSKEDYQIILKGLKECKESQGESTFRIKWNHNGMEKTFACKVSYEGMLGEYAVMLIVIMDVTTLIQ